MPHILSVRTVRAALALAATGIAVATVTPAPAAPNVPTLPADARSGCAARSTARLAGTPWAQQLLYPQRVWPLTTGAGVRVAVLDTGIAAAPQLAGHVSRAGADCAGRGTFVAGLIAAGPSQGTGFEGIAPGATVLPVRVTDAAGTATPTAVAAGITTALRDHAEVVCLSTVVTGSSAALRSAVRAANRRGVPIVTPAFADATTTGAREPALNPLAGQTGVVAVAAVGPDGKDVATAPAGATVDVYAPGRAVLGIGPGGGQFVGSGGGVAAGFVAGTAALIRAYRPRLSAAELAQRLTGSAFRQLTTGAAGTIDPYAAVTTALPAGPAATRAPVRLAAPVAPTGPAGTSTALTVVGLAVAGIVAPALAGAVLRRGRRRGWRPAVLTARGPAGTR